MADSKQIIDEENEQSSRVRERNRTLDWEAIDSERLNALKQARSAKKDLVTKAQNEIRDLMLDFANVTVVKENVDELKKIVDQFNEAHSAYHSQLREESDLVESDEYSQLVNNSVKEVTGDIARWVASEEFASSRFEVPGFKDSVSNVGSKASGRSKLSSAASKVSRSSSVSAAKAKAAARRAGLQAEADNLESFQAIQREEFSLQQRKKALELRTEIAKAEAEELAYAKAEASCVGSPNPSQIVVRRQESGHHEELSPDTKRAVPGSSEDTDRKVHIKSPNVKAEEANPAKPKEPALTGTFAHRLLEAHFQQNRRMEELIHKQQESTLALTLPEPEVPTFNGNPIEYWTFVRAFENLIERKTASENARLYYLVQYTIGEVQELVKSCLSMDPEEGYRKARILLKQRLWSTIPNCHRLS